MAINFDTYQNSHSQSITVRYQVSSKWATWFEMREFATKQAAQHFLNQHLPANATNLDIWVTDNSPRQEPTWAGKAERRNRWWDENKRPFTDRYTEEDAR